MKKAPVVIAVVIALVVGVMVALLMAPGGEVGGPGGEPEGGADSRLAVTGSDPQSLGGSDVGNGEAQGGGVGAGEAGAAASSTGNRDKRTPFELGDEFTEEDARYADDPIVVDFGTYRVKVGEEFTVSVRLSAPSLENVCLYAEFDPTRLAGVPGSGEKVGKAFRHGIEFYTREHQGVGQAVIINETLPGGRSLNPTQGEVVAKFRMRALDAGVAQLAFPKGDVSFTNAVGADREDYEIRGGRVEVLP